MEKAESISGKNDCGITRSKVAELLEPVISLHNIELKDDHMEFQGILSYTGLLEQELSENTQKTVILYKDISRISSFEARIEVLLQSGELYSFSLNDTVRTHINTYKNSETVNSVKPTTAQDVAGNIWDGLEKTLSSTKK